jgi:hypothetical protein
VVAHLIQHPISEPTTLPTPTSPNEAKHPPPDILTLQQRLLI